MFACVALRVWGPLLPVWRQQVRQLLHRLIHAFDSVHAFFEEVSIVRGLTTRSSVALAVLTALLDWPDVLQPQRYLTGFPAVSHIEPTGLFHEIPDTQVLQEDEFLGQAAFDFVDELLRKPPSPDASTIWDLTVEEQSKGWCSGPFWRAQMDAKFQPAGWKPVPRFLVTQPCGKLRLMDDTKKGSHNQATAMKETIYTIGINRLSTMVDGLARSVLDGDVHAPLPPWFIPTACVVDLPDAYRGCPVEPSQRCFTIAATFSLQHRAWRFWEYTRVAGNPAVSEMRMNKIRTKEGI